MFPIGGVPEEQVKKSDDEEKSFTQFNVADDASMEYYFASDARYICKNFKLFYCNFRVFKRVCCYFHY